MFSSISCGRAYVNEWLKNPDLRFGELLADIVRFANVFT